MVFSRIDHINHFRVIGWYNAALGFAFFVLLIFTFHGEFKRNGRHSYLSLSLVRSQGAECCQKSTIITQLVSYFLVNVCASSSQRVHVSYKPVFKEDTYI